MRYRGHNARHDCRTDYQHIDPCPRKHAAIGHHRAIGWQRDDTADDGTVAHTVANRRR